MAFGLLIFCRVWYLQYTAKYHNEYDPRAQKTEQSYVNKNMADTAGMMLSQLLIAVIIHGLARRQISRTSLDKLEQEVFPDLEIEEFDIEDEFQAKIWTQFVREDDVFKSTIADSVAITSFIDKKQSYSVNAEEGKQSVSVSQYLAISNNSGGFPERDSACFPERDERDETVEVEDKQDP